MCSIPAIRICVNPRWLRSRLSKVDIVVDNVGGALFNQVIAMLGYAGRISVVGRSAGEVPDFNTASLFFKRNRIGGVAVSDFTPEQAQAAWKEITAG